MPQQHPRPEGFTLLELLVAIAILALIAVASFRLVSDTVMVRDRGLQHEQALQSLQKAEMIMQRDLVQAASRSVRDEFGDDQPALYFPKENTMELTRRGWRNPLQEVRSDMIRVRYRVENEQLIREHWQVLDRARLSAPVKIVLLDKVSDFHLQAFANGSWSTTWPTLAQSQKDRKVLPLPEAVEIRFSLQPWGEIRRVIPLPETDSNVNQNAKSTP
ncbi:MAG: type II secretion system minor pseudopilin GspJ [bacterium]|nr:type II secretion system minor pseudopilin GspJ [bacterium]